jgi:alkylglycerol monooxygenase
MGPNYIALAVPFFFVLIGIELIAARLLKKRVYRFSDSVGDIGCGIAQQTMLLFTGALILAGYAYVYDHYRIYTFESAALAWLFAFLAVDFVYYWWHRLSHRMNILWAAHVVHHQSEEYNLSVALRQSIFTSFTVFPFYALIAALGVPPVVLGTSVAFSTLYQFWIHTRLIGSLGPLEWVLNTPAHHRGHHAVNPRYVDTNYGATLIIWDRLFGTFAKEIEEPVYGITKPLKSFSPVWAQIAPLVDLREKVRAAPRLIDKVRMILMPPGWVPSPSGGYELAIPEVSAATFKPFDTAVSGAIKVYVLVQLALMTTVTFLVMLVQHDLEMSVVAAAAAITIFGLTSFGALLDGRSWGSAAEVARLVFVVAAAVALSWSSARLPYIAAGAVAFGVVSALCLRLIVRKAESAPVSGPVSEPGSASASVSVSAS